MKLAIMQPYIFPYIGYFQLIYAVDKFVFLDDVNFINRGWINRNRILVNGNSHTFTVPLKNASQNRLINNILILENEWQDQLIKTIEFAYKKAPQFQYVFTLLKDVIYSSVTDIATLAKKSIEAVYSYLQITTKLVSSSTKYDNKDLKSESRIIDIAVRENASEYINPTGGIELYNKQNFLQKGIQLHFLKTKEINYKQFNNQFIPFLSVIDVMMFNEKQEVQKMILQFDLT